MNHLTAGFVVSAILLHDLGPEHAGSAEFGELHEVVARNAHVELDAVSHFSGIETLVGKQGEPFGAPCQGVAEFFVDICAGIGEHHRVNGEYAQSGHVLDDCEHLGTHLGDVAGEFNAVLEGFLEGIEVDGTVEFVGEVVGLEVVNEHAGKVEGLAGAAHKVELNGCHVDAFEERGEFVGRGILDFETEGIDTLGEHVNRLGVGVGRAVGYDFLAREPVIVSAGTANKRVFAGE